MIKVIVLILFFCLFFNVYSPVEAKEIKIGELNFAIPEQWNKLPQSTEKMDIFIVEGDSNPYGNFKIIIMISTASISKDLRLPNLTLEQSLRLNLVALKKDTNAIIEDTGDITVAGKEYKWMRYYRNNEMTIEYIILHKDNQVLIKFGCLDKRNEKFVNEFKKILEEISLK